MASYVGKKLRVNLMVVRLFEVTTKASRLARWSRSIARSM